MLKTWILTADNKRYGLIDLDTLKVCDLSAPMKTDEGWIYCSPSINLKPSDLEGAVSFDTEIEMKWEIAARLQSKYNAAWGLPIT